MVAFRVRSELLLANTIIYFGWSTSMEKPCSILDSFGAHPKQIWISKGAEQRIIHRSFRPPLWTDHFSLRGATLLWSYKSILSRLTVDAPFRVVCREPCEQAGAIGGRGVQCDARQWDSWGGAAASSKLFFLSQLVRLCCSCDSRSTGRTESHVKQGKSAESGRSFDETRTITGRVARALARTPVSRAPLITVAVSQGGRTEDALIT